MDYVHSNAVCNRYVGDASMAVGLHVCSCLNAAVHDSTCLRPDVTANICDYASPAHA